MKAITLHQPWASLIVHGEKIHETRSWKPRDLQIGDQLAIHAGKTWGASTQQSWYALQQRHPAACALIGSEPPRGVVVGIVRYLGAVRMTVPFIRSQSPQEIAFGNWQVGRYAWKLAVVETFDPPIPARGNQGIWEWGGTRQPVTPAPMTTISPAHTLDLDSRHQVTTTAITPHQPGAFYRWAAKHFGPADYHRAEHYARAVHALAIAVYCFKHTPVFTGEDLVRLRTVIGQLKRMDVADRKTLLDEKHALENKQEKYRKAKARIFGCEIDLNTALRWISVEDRHQVDHLIYGYPLNHNMWQQHAA